MHRSPELLDRTLIWQSAASAACHARVRIFYNTHRPHQGIATARPLAPVPEAITNPDQLAHLRIPAAIARRPAIRVSTRR
jgi:putative transposase